MNSAVDMTAPYITSAAAIESRLGDETVLLDLTSSTYFGLDPIGTIVWEQLKAGAAPKDICHHVRETVADAPDTVEADIEAFLAQLAENGLIRRG